MTDNPIVYGAQSIEHG
jgi:hypothetical protein